jgi:hypothetical protein
MINISPYQLSLCFAICYDKVLVNPLDKMVFEGALDNLMKNIGGKKFMDISTRKICCEELRLKYQYYYEVMPTKISSMIPHPNHMSNAEKPCLRVLV